METLEAIRTRRSVRSFTPKAVSDDILQEILLDARAAPSAGNLQARDFVVIRDDARKIAIAQAALNQYFIAQADVVIVVCANSEKSSPYGRRGKELYSTQDADAAAMNILLSVHDRGLASVWIGAFDEIKVANLLNVPGHARPVAILPIGYPGAGVGESPRTGRHPLESMVHNEVW